MFKNNFLAISNRSTAVLGLKDTMSLSFLMWYYMSKCVYRLYNFELPKIVYIDEIGLVSR